MKSTTALLGMLAVSAGVSGELNDTGVQSCSDGTTVGIDCDDLASSGNPLPGQDADYGRDSSEADPSDGLGGFAFTKLDDVGLPLADQTADYASSPWSCVRDDVTGLTWEVKTDDEGLHDRDWTYSWYTSSGSNDSDFPGIESGGECVDAENCDTEKFAAAVNAAGLCGHSDWRMPGPSRAAIHRCLCGHAP